MPEYTYLLETRLTVAQRNALSQVRDAAREAGMVVFLTGGAVRDLTTGSSVRDLDFSVQGDALELEAAMVARGAEVWGRHVPSRTLFLWLPGSVRVELAATRSETFPKTGKPVYRWDGIIDDLFRRDFTANAMALSLNEGSYGLLLDPLNGVADTEARQLRLVSNYGFLEDPSRLLRAARLTLRLGWTMEERTAVRYQNAKEADNFGDIADDKRGYELEEIASEDDALGVMRAFEAEGWMEKLLPEWTSSDADVAALDHLHQSRIQLLMQGITPDLMAAHLELLTTKMKPDGREQLKALMVRTGLKEQWERLDEGTKQFSRLLTGKDAATPSAAWKLFHEHAAEPILWLAHTGRGTVESKFKQLFSVWPEVAKQVPVATMTELRITPELPAYSELLHALFLEQIDGKLQSDEEMRAFLEKYSPPAPPPPVSLKRSRSRKAETKSKKKSSAAEADETLHSEEEEDGEEAVEVKQVDQSRQSEQPRPDERVKPTPREAPQESQQATPATKASPATKVTPAAKAAPTQAAPSPKPSKKDPADAVKAARSGEVNLAGVDLGSMLERIQGKQTSAQAEVHSTPPAHIPSAKPPARMMDKQPALPLSVKKGERGEIAKTEPQPAVQPKHGAGIKAPAKNAQPSSLKPSGTAKSPLPTTKKVAPAKKMAVKQTPVKVAPPAKSAKNAVKVAAVQTVPAKKAAVKTGATKKAGPAVKKKGVAKPSAKPPATSAKNIAKTARKR